MKIKNISSSIISINDLLDRETKQPITLDLNEEMIIYDEDAEGSSTLKRYIDGGYIQVTGKEEPVEIEDIVGGGEERDTYLVKKTLLGADVAIQFTPVNGAGNDNAYAGAINTDKDITLAITNGNGGIDYVNSTATIVVSITGGTAGTKQIRLIGGVYGAGPVTLSFVEGEAKVQVKGTVGTITLGLSGGNTSLNKTDTATCTLA